MSKVDLTPIVELKEKYDGDNERLQYFVYSLCEGDFLLSDEEVGVVYPNKGDRSYSDPTFQKECAEYRAEKSHKEFELTGYKHLQQEGGGEGGAEYCFGVFQLHDKIYKAEYSYYSYDGHNYDYILDTLQEVKPVEKTIIVYEPV